MNSGPGADAGALLLSAAAGRQLRIPGGRRGADRGSLIGSDAVLVHADLHNHTLLSDGQGDPDEAFPSMRAAGLDVAALTDHAIRGATVAGTGTGGTPWIGLDRAGWQRTGELADAHDKPGEFAAIRGFEWSHPRLGHVNIWFTDDFTDVATNGDMHGLYAWLARQAGGDGAAEGEAVPWLAGFNHPGRERGRFEDFCYEPAVADQLVSMEMFNRTDDYLFEGVRAGAVSPLVAALDAGWRPGLIGVTDEHGTDWGFPEGRGRAGLWVAELSRAGVAAAMRARRSFATRVSGLRVDAAADGVPMGSVLRHRRGTVDFALDLDRGPSWAGRQLQVQVLRPDAPAPAVADVVEARCGEVTRFGVPVDIEDGGWMLLRIADPEEPNDNPGPYGHPANNFGLAYTSPWYLEP